MSYIYACLGLVKVIKQYPKSLRNSYNSNSLFSPISLKPLISAHLSFLLLTQPPTILLLYIMLSTQPT